MVCLENSLIRKLSFIYFCFLNNFFVSLGIENLINFYHNVSILDQRSTFFFVVILEQASRNCYR